MIRNAVEQKIDAELRNFTLLGKEQHSRESTEIERLKADLR